MDEETKFRETMMKVKRWMTEILLGVTNKEIKAVCNEVCACFCVLPYISLCALR